MNKKVAIFLLFILSGKCILSMQENNKQNETSGVTTEQQVGKEKVGSTDSPSSSQNGQNSTVSSTPVLFQSTQGNQGPTQPPQGNPNQQILNQPNVSLQGGFPMMMSPFGFGGYGGANATNDLLTRITGIEGVKGFINQELLREFLLKPTFKKDGNGNYLYEKDVDENFVLDKDGRKIALHNNDDFMTLVLRGDYGNALKRSAQYCVISSSLTGALGAMNDVSNSIFKNVLETAYSGVSNSWQRLYNFFCHDNAEPFSGLFLERVINRVDSMLRGIRDAAHQSSIDGDIGKGLLRFQQYQGDGSKMRTDDSAVQKIDDYWGEIKKYYLMVILQIIREIRMHQKYYAACDAIVTASNNLIISLVGDFSFDKKSSNVAIGGIYAHIVNAQNLTDLAAPNVSRSLELLHQNIKSAIAEISVLINTKANEEASLKGFLSGTKHSRSDYNFRYDD